MNKIAVMDIGSNSVRLMTIADGKVLYKTIKTTQLGEGLAFSSCLKETAMERTVSALKDFCNRARSEGADELYAFATAAVRSADNAQEFKNLVRERCGLDLEVLSGEEEARLGLLGSLGNEDGAIIDVGGASTELIIRADGKVVYAKSLDIGVVRIKDLCGREQRAVRELSEEYVQKFESPLIPKRVCAIGGTATTLAAVKLGLFEYDRNKVSNTILTYEDMKNLSECLFSKSVEEIEKIPCVDRLRANVIAGGAEWLRVIMGKLGIDRVFVSDGDNLEGYALSRGLL